jgi:hypothetical protein
VSVWAIANSASDKHCLPFSPACRPERLQRLHTVAAACNLVPSCILFTIYTHYYVPRWLACSGDRYDLCFLPRRASEYSTIALVWRSFDCGFSTLQ